MGGTNEDAGPPSLNEFVQGASTNVTFNFSAETYERLAAFAKARDVSIGEAVRQAVALLTVSTEPLPFNSGNVLSAKRPLSQALAVARNQEPSFQAPGLFARSLLFGALVYLIILNPRSFYDGAGLVLTVVASYLLLTVVESFASWTTAMKRAALLAEAVARETKSSLREDLYMGVGKQFDVRNRRAQAVGRTESEHFTEYRDVE